MAVWRFNAMRCEFERVPAIVRDDDHREGISMDHTTYLVAEPDPNSLFGWLLYLDEGGGMIRRILPYERTFIVSGTVFEGEGYMRESHLPDHIEVTVKKLLAGVAERVRWTGKP